MRRRRKLQFADTEFNEVDGEYKRVRSRSFSARGFSVGLLGGSFNPAHGGHVYISSYARKRLGLRQVWWLPAVRNPLKESTGDYDMRVASARSALSGCGVAYRVCEVDRLRGYRYTWQTVQFLRRRYRHIRFVWLMGADCWRELPHWRHWRWLFRRIPFVIFAREPVALREVGNRSGVVLRHYRLPVRRSLVLKYRRRGWIYFPMVRQDISSGLLRGDDVAG